VRIAAVLEMATDRLRQAGIPDAGLEATIMLTHLLGVNRAGLILTADRAIEPALLDTLERWLGRRREREPLAYILGEWEFWSLPFKVTNAVLIPRPETEFLVETALRTVRDSGEKLPALIADLGIGSGAVAVVLALELPHAMVYGIDLSLAALRVARDNIKTHRVEDRVLPVNGDWLAALRPERLFDLVVSNPPYIASPLLERPWGPGADRLQPEVGQYEPRQALDGGRHGLEAIDRIAADLHNHLKPGGWLFMEIGADQGDYVARLFRELAYLEVMVHRDYAGLPRVLQARQRQ